MKQNANIPNNSHSKSSQEIPWQEPQQTKIKDQIYQNHMSEVVVWATMFSKEKLYLDELQAAALVGCIKDLSEEFNLDCVAMNMEDIIKTLLQKITYDDQLTVNGRAKHADQIEQLLKISRLLRIIDQNIIPYTQP
jgi:hypothetical protein